MDEDKMTQLLEEKIAWMEGVYNVAVDLETYKWIKAPSIRHRCGGDVYVFVEMTGIGYVCTKCQEAEVL